MIDPTSLLLSFLLATAPQGTSADPAQAETRAADEKQAEADDENKIICRRTAVIGSKFKKKICGTKKQWETLEARATEDTRQLQRRGKGLEPVN